MIKCKYSSPADARDYTYLVEALGDTAPSVSLVEYASPVDDQFLLSSCVANAIVNAYELMLIKRDPSLYVDLSRLFVYYNTRQLEDTLLEDSGVMYIRNALAAVKQYGVCREDLWPYDISKFTVKPSAACYTDALSRTISEYSAVPDIESAIVSIANGKPVVLGLLIFEEFYNLNFNNYQLSIPQDASSGGGHAVCIVGYDLATEAFLIKNSFGTLWGDNGYAIIPFRYVEQYGFEMWNFSIGEQTAHQH